MGFTNQGSRGTTDTRSSGRGFAAVDPERQREIDLEHARKIARQEESSLQRSNRPLPMGWLSTLRDPGDEGGSVRRSR